MLEQNFAGEGIAVGVQAAGFDADDDVAGFDGFLAVEHPGFFDDADDGAADVVFALLVEAGHLGGFAADEGALVLGTGAGETFDDFSENVRLEFAGAEVIEEKEGFSAEHGDVVDAMVDEVGADGVVLIELEGDLELGADAVHAADEDGLVIFFQVEGEEAAKPADFAEDFAAMGAGEELGQGGFDLVAEIDVNAGGGVGFLFHARGE